MLVSEICRRNPVTIRAAEELGTAAALMRERHIGYLIVVEPHPPYAAPRPVGVLTDRDLVVTVLAKGADMRLLKVGDVMTRDPVVVSEDGSLNAALAEMRRIGVRRIPVVDAVGQLVGVLALDEVLDALAQELLGVIGSIRTELRTESARRP
ncbi:MAG TPA: CBS domain-containing protein [Steroidobacteraceae bacterium]|nr:CBS domain-containing protein [Steroidobacteraceae bacterium]